MSLRFDVKFSNAVSITESSVFASTTRKFFWESGGAVTCCSNITLLAEDCWTSDGGKIGKELAETQGNISVAGVGAQLDAREFENTKCNVPQYQRAASPL